MAKYKERRNGPNYKKQRTALDDLTSLDRIKKATEVTKGNTESEFEFSHLNTNVSKNLVDYSSDSSGQGKHVSHKEQVYLTKISQQVRKFQKLIAKHPKKSSKLQVSRAKDTTIFHCELDTNASGSESDRSIQPSGIAKSNVNYDSTEATSTNEEDAMVNVNMARGRYSRKKGYIYIL